MKETENFFFILTLQFLSSMDYYFQSRNSLSSRLENTLFMCLSLVIKNYNIRVYQEIVQDLVK